ncbi:hypothetical protein R3P38DRAFT_2951827 [Favolaschia claudopus]|uniref:Lectin n=1 Tax=Favolaschia claudopus TaxID=2862362 RepID=A0AAW0BF84_9AGAR
MIWSLFLAILPLVSGTVLVKYSAAAGDQTSALGLLNLGGYDDAQWPSGQSQNDSAYFKTATDPNGVPAAHVHKAQHFARAEYHLLKGKTEVDKTYYIGYHVMWKNVDYQTIVMQWKNYDPKTTPTANIPACLVFRNDASGSANHTMQVFRYSTIFHLNAEPDPTVGNANSVWAKQLNMGTAYRFGFVINTSQTKGYLQLYFNGALSTLTDPSTGKTTQKLAGNFWPGPTVDPKFGLYGGKNNLVDDSYIYEIVVGTELADIAAVAGIST